MSLSKEVHNLMDSVYQTLNGFNEVIITDEDFDNSEDVIYEAPRIAQVSKYGYYDEYVIMSLNDGIMNVRGISEGIEDEVFKSNVVDLSYN
jgi:gentisate 1,2-dioxygenase